MSLGRVLQCLYTMPTANGLWDSWFESLPSDGRSIGRQVRCLFCHTFKITYRFERMLVHLGYCPNGVRTLSECTAILDQLKEFFRECGGDVPRRPADDGRVPDSFQVPIEEQDDHVPLRGFPADVENL